MELSFKVEKLHVLPKPNKNILAYADLLVNDVLVICGLRVCDGKKGTFVSFSQVKGKNKEGKEEWYSQQYFKDKTIDAVMQEVVLKEYEAKKTKNV